MKSKKELTYEEYVKLRETHGVGETKRIIKQNEKDEKSKQEKRKNEELNLTKKEKRKTLIPETLRIAKVLNVNGVNLKKIDITEKGNYLILGDIKQDGIDIPKIIEENGLNSEFRFGMGVYKVRCAYKEKGPQRLTEEEKREVESLGLLEREKEESVVSKTLKIARILNDEGIDFRKMHFIKNGEFILLEEIEQDEIDIQKIIEEYKLDGKFPIRNGSL